jgi:hypothetical protein
MDKKKTVIWMIMGVILSVYVAAVPPVACEFYGLASIDLQSAKSGLNVTAFDPDGVLCGKFQIARPGFYGSLSCKLDDPSTLADEGAEAGEPIRLVLNNTNRTQASGDVKCEQGMFSFVNISYLTWYCGDGICNTGESCTNCALDCGECPNPNDPPPPSGEGGTAGAKGYTTGGGGGGGASFSVPPLPPCKEEWSCSKWSKCPREGSQNRTCIDLNACGTNKSKEPETQVCVYPGDCFDGIKNNGELGLDCGGLCPSCPSCFDGLQNQGEEYVDCGGPCPPCSVIPPGLEYPSPLGSNCGDNVCDSGEECTCPSDCRKFPWGLVWTVAILLFVVKAALVVYLFVFMKRDIPRGIKFQRKHTINRTYFWLLVLTVLFGLSVALFIYFTGGCWDLMVKFSWVLVIEMLLVPLIGYFVLKLFEYSEERRKKSLRGAMQLFNEELVSLYKLQAQELPRVEEEFLEGAEAARRAKEGYMLLEKYVQMDQLVDFVKFIHENGYSEDLEARQKCDKVVEKAIEVFDELSKDEGFKAAVSTDELKALFEKLGFLISQYSERQHLSEELAAVTAQYEAVADRPSYLPRLKDAR